MLVQALKVLYRSPHLVCVENEQDLWKLLDPRNTSFHFASL